MDKYYLHYALIFYPLLIKRVKVPRLFSFTKIFRQFLYHKCLQLKQETDGQTQLFTNSVALFLPYPIRNLANNLLETMIRDL
jgi:hypothetical protein